MDRRANPLQLRLFGGVELRLDRASDAPAPGRKVRTLLAYLALNVDLPCPREKLMALLWGDRAEEQARASLRQALTELRHALGEPSPLRTEQDTVSLDSAAVTVDAIEFARLAKAGKLEEAAALYRGPLLDGHSVRDGAFEDWLRIERTRLHDLAVETLHRLAESQSGDNAIATTQRLLQLDPAREETHRLLMRLYAAVGQRAQALRQYQQCCDALERELQTKPDKETERLYQQIQDQTVPSSVASTRVSLNSKPTIAVLPFTNMSGDPEQQYFSDGITEDIITQLSRFHSLVVIARNSSFQYRDKAADVRSIARELSVQYIVMGSIRKVGHNIRISTQLIDANSGSHLWAERYDQGIESIFAIQDEVVATIVARVAGQITGAGMEKVRRKGTANLEAYDYLLRALDHHARTGGDNFNPVISLLQRAVDADPNFAEVHARLAIGYLYLYWEEAYAPVLSKASLDRALEAATKAVALDDNDAICHLALGLVLLQRRSYDLAKHHLDIALDLNPNDVTVIGSRAIFEQLTGRPEAALELVNKVERLDPRHPNWCWEARGMALYLLRHYSEAAEAFEKMILAPKFVDRFLAACYAQSGRLDDAKAKAAEAIKREPGFHLHRYAMVEPFKSQADLDHMIEGMRKAGLPE